MNRYSYHLIEDAISEKLLHIAILAEQLAHQDTPTIFLTQGLYVLLQSIMQVYLLLHESGYKGIQPFFCGDSFIRYWVLRKSLRVASVLMGCYSNIDLLEPIGLEDFITDDLDTL